MFLHLQQTELQSECLHDSHLIPVHETKSYETSHMLLHVSCTIHNLVGSEHEWLPWRLQRNFLYICSRWPQPRVGVRWCRRRASFASSPSPASTTTATSTWRHKTSSSRSQKRHRDVSTGSGDAKPWVTSLSTRDVWLARCRPFPDWN